MSTVIPPKCFERRCIHFFTFQLSEYPEIIEELEKVRDTISESYIPRCAAFPEGIPKDIARGDNPHYTPIEGDNNIQYRMMDEDEEKFYLFGDE